MEKQPQRAHDVALLPAMRKTEVDLGLRGILPDPLGRELYYFLIFFPTKILGEILQSTNSKLEAAKYAKIDEAEFFSFVGVLLLLTQDTHPRRREVWMSQKDPSVIQTTMSRERFEHIWSCLRVGPEEEEVSCVFLEVDVRQIASPDLHFKLVSEWHLRPRSPLSSGFQRTYGGDFPARVSSYSGRIN